MVLNTGSREAFDDFHEHARLELAGAQIVQEKQRLGAEHGDVIGTMVDEIRPDGVVRVHCKGNLEFCANAVHAGNQDRLAILPDVESEQTPEASHFAKHFSAMRGRQQLRQRRLDLVAQINVHSRTGISFSFHAQED